MGRARLVARKVAVIKVKLCVTFGTPHRGAELAAHPYRFLGAYAGLMSQERNALSVYRPLSYFAQQREFEGIDDLRPAEAHGEFLRELEYDERELAPPKRLRNLKVLTVGGIYRDRKRHLMSMMTHLLGTTEQDLVVRKKSTVPNTFPGGAVTMCSHFEYFSAGEIEKAHFREVIEAIRKALGFRKAEEERLTLLMQRNAAVPSVEPSPYTWRSRRPKTTG